MSVPADSPEVIERYESAVELVSVVARQVRRTVGVGVGVAELESCGREGLFAAARRYDQDRKVPFRAYAYLRIRGAILDGVRAIMPLPRRTWVKLRALDAGQRLAESRNMDLSGASPPDNAVEADAALAEHLGAIATAMAVGLLRQSAVGECGEPILGDSHDDPEEAALRRELHRRVDQAIAKLPDIEGILVRAHYLEGQRFDEVALRLGLSKSWASRLHRRAIERLVAALRECDAPA